MCDTIVATPSAVAGGSLLFGKNSDRQRDEAQAVEIHPACDYGDAEQLRCTYISVPQVRRTHAVLLSRPYWLWGAEMGANEHGVVIGNEGLHARVPASEVPALTGMDLIRLGLERSTSADEAVSIITGLLQSYGQGGDCGHQVPAFYNNGFLIADRHQAFVLETLDRDWALEPVSGIRTLSNIYSIDAPTEASAGFGERIASGSSIKPGAPGWAAAITNPNREHIGRAAGRRARSLDLLRSSGPLCAADMMRTLRDHDGIGGGCDRPHLSLCMHAGDQAGAGQTTASLVSELSATPRHWVTASSAPCLSIFKPAFLDVPIPDARDHGSEVNSSNSLWWRHERFHRAVMRVGLGRFLQLIEPERDAIEQEFQAGIEAVAGADVAERTAFIRDCWSRAAALERVWCERFVRLDSLGGRESDFLFEVERE